MVSGLSYLNLPLALQHNLAFINMCTPKTQREKLIYFVSSKKTKVSHKLIILSISHSSILGWSGHSSLQKGYCSFCSILHLRSLSEQDGWTRIKPNLQYVAKPFHNYPHSTQFLFLSAKSFPTYPWSSKFNFHWHIYSNPVSYRSNLFWLNSCHFLGRSSIRTHWKPNIVFGWKLHCPARNYFWFIHFKSKYTRYPT